MDKLRVGYVCLARLTFDGEYAREVMQRTRTALAGMENVELVCPDDLTVEEEDAEAAAELFNREKVDVVVVQYGTFSLGSLMPLFADRLSVPIVVWGVPEPSFGGKLRINSLCGVNMNAHTLMRLGRKYETLFCNPEEGPAELDRLFRVLHCLRRLRHVRLGLVGYRVPGFYTSNCDELDLRVGDQIVDRLHVVLQGLLDVRGAARTEPSQGNPAQGVGDEATQVQLVVGVHEVGREGIFALPTSCIVPREPDEPLRDIRTWPACRLPAAPG